MPPICTKPLTAGDVIFESKPLIHVLDLEYKGIYCDNCVERSDQLKRCSKCLRMYYCDKSCQSMDWKYHKNECKVFRSKAFDPNLFTAKQRIFLRFWFCIKFDEIFATKRHQLFDGSDVCLNDLKVNGEALDKIELINTSFDELLPNFKDYGLDSNRKELFHWFAVFATNSSMFSRICRKKWPYFPIGFGFYIELLTLSHSCCPNADVVNIKGLSLQLRAMKSIGFGEELTISYIDLAKTKTQRQTELKTRYLFDCNCDKCVHNLDSGVDYRLIDNFRQIIIENTLNDTLVVESIEFLEFISQLMSQLNAIYGKYNPQKTTQLLTLFQFCIKINYSNQEFIRQLMDIIDENIGVTHGESHLFNYHFQLLRQYYSSDKLLIL